MSLTIMKRIRFSAGHRLMGHGGKCERFHGHNYVLEIYLTGEEVDEVGRLVDFSELKRAFQGWIDQHWDHAFLVSEQDQNAIQALKLVEPSHFFVLPYNPTAENLARYLLEEVGPQVALQLSNPTVSISRIVLWETEDSFAEASVDQHAFPENYRQTISASLWQSSDS